MTQHTTYTVRNIEAQDYAAWLPLWDGYNAFYGRHSATALPAQVTQSTWARFFNVDEPVYALVAQRQGQVVGLAHYLFHHSMIRVEPICYLSDLFTLPALRGQGVGRLLIEAVSAQAKAYGATRVYWQTHETNATGRLLYDKVAKHQGSIVYSRDA
jgi:GNAT superfamily N-acetyltransferase